MRITKFGHACLLVEEGEARILIDPGAYSSGFEDLDKLSAVLITHQHQDHLNLDALVALQAKNPGLQVYADEGSVGAAAEKMAFKPVHAGEEFEVAGVKVEVIGTDHAVIHPTLPGIPNVGYFINQHFFYPGDNFTLPNRPVDILGLPAGAPWLKISDAIDYMLAVHPEVAIPVHDAVLALPEIHYGLLQRFAEPAGVELRVVENGTSTEV